MKRAIVAALIASTLLTGLSISRANDAAAAEAEGGQSEGGRTMDAPYIAVPVVRNGLLNNYLFVSVRFNIAPGVDLWATREKAQFLRDALVRVSHSNALADPNNPDQLDQAHAIAVYFAAARQVLGPQAVQSVSIMSCYSSRGGPPREMQQSAPPARPSGH